jgi:hypothetical protein
MPYGAEVIVDSTLTIAKIIALRTAAIDAAARDAVARLPASI